MSNSNKNQKTIPDTPKQILSRQRTPPIAYHKIRGKSPSIIFLSGFKSDMSGTKATALEQFCRNIGISYLRFDYSGHGESGGKFVDCCITDWVNDTLDVLDNLTKGPLILVGSSMGGWIMLLAALARPERITGLVGIAAAPDFTTDLIRKNLSPQELENINKTGSIKLTSDYDDPYVITKHLLEDGENNLLLRKPIQITCPIRLLHGLNDVSVPWETSLKLMNQLTSLNVELTLIKEGDHRLSRKQDIERLNEVILTII